MLHTEVIRVQHIGAMADGYQKAQNLQLSGTSYMCLYEAENSEPNLSEIIGGINKNGFVFGVYMNRISRHSTAYVLNLIAGQGHLSMPLEIQYKDSSVCYFWVHVSIYNPIKSISLPTTFSRARPRSCWYRFLGFYDTVRKNK